MSAASCHKRKVKASSVGGLLTVTRKSWHEFFVSGVSIMTGPEHNYPYGKFWMIVNGQELDNLKPVTSINIMKTFDF